MKIVEKETGLKIPYHISGNKITFNDELMLNLQKYERDFEQNLDVCVDENACLAMGLAKNYVAQIIIPARQYTEAIGLEESPDGNGMESAPPDPIPFNMANATLVLWNTEGLFNE